MSELQLSNMDRKCLALVWAYVQAVVDHSNVVWGLPWTCSKPKGLVDHVLVCEDKCCRGRPFATKCVMKLRAPVAPVFYPMAPKSSYKWTRRVNKKGKSYIVSQSKSTGASTLAWRFGANSLRAAFAGNTSALRHGARYSASGFYWASRKSHSAYVR